MDGRFTDIATRGSSGETITREECSYMLRFPENAQESAFIIGLADRILRRRVDNTAALSVQIGIQTSPCVGNCRFCNFNRTSNKRGQHFLTDDELSYYIERAVRYDDVRVISLMTMQNYDIDHLKHSIGLVKGMVKDDVRITLNIGDTSYDDCVELRKAGATGAYHACRLREGKDTDLDPEDRWRTMRNFIDAGFILSTCTEPIGPEHSVDEILDNYYKGLEIGADSGSVMMRVPVEGTPLFSGGSLSMQRISQIRATLFICSLGLGKKESKLDGWKYGYFNGFNRFHAEYGGNPRDSADRSEDGYGFTIEYARRMAFNRGFDKLLLPDGSVVALDEDYLKRTDSL